MSMIDTLRRTLLGGLDLLGDWGMLQAAVARLADKTGISIGVPENPGEEITPQIRVDILAARARYSEEEWLLPKGPRDQLCVRLGVSRGQIAGVLAGDARRANGASNGSGATQQIDRGAGANYIPTITEDPATWPVRPGHPATPPARKQHELDAFDWEIAKAVIAAGQWDARRRDIMRIRGLSPQQVAGMKATLTRSGSPAVNDHDA